VGLILLFLSVFAARHQPSKATDSIQAPHTRPQLHIASAHCCRCKAGTLTRLTATLAMKAHLSQHVVVLRHLFAAGQSALEHVARAILQLGQRHDAVCKRHTDMMPVSMMLFASDTDTMSVSITTQWGPHQHQLQHVLVGDPRYAALELPHRLPQTIHNGLQCSQSGTPSCTGAVKTAHETRLPERLPGTHGC